MKHSVIVAATAMFLCVAAWAVPISDVQRPVAVSADGEAASPTRVVREPGDIPAGYQLPPPPVPTEGEPPQITEGTDVETPMESNPLWGPDATVYDDNIKYITPLGSERMIAYDRSSDSTVFAAFTVPNGDTARIYRSTDGGSNWAPWNLVYHTGNVLTSLELVVAEGDSDFVFFFFKSSAGNGDVYVCRWNLDGPGSAVYQVKVDSDTIASFSACRDVEDHYYLYVTYERRAGDYGMYIWRSTDYGKTWDQTSYGYVIDTETPPMPDICYGRNGHVYAVLRDLARSSVDSASFRLKHSPNRGDTWMDSEQVGTPLVTVAEPIVGARHNRNTAWLVHSRNLGGDNGWSIFSYTSTDTGASWELGVVSNEDVDEEMPSIACNLGTGSPTLSYTVTPGESIMFTWSPEDTIWTAPLRVNDHRGTGFFASQAGWMTGYSSVLYAGYTALGLYFDAFHMTGVKESRVVAGSRTTLAARPCPALDRATVNYSLPEAGPARVSVSDIAGREVAVIEQGTFAAGARSVVWNCKEMQAGVYLFRVETRTGSQTGRLVVSH